jgi:anti-sigma factor RsiW
MNCHNLANLLDAYVDRELDLIRSVEVEQHLQDCARCDDVRRGVESMRRSIARPELYFKAPDALVTRLREEFGAPTAPPPEPLALPQQMRPPRRRPLALTLAIAACVGLIALTPTLLLIHRAAEQFVDEVTAAHVRSLMADHLTDVASPDTHKVKPWFNGKIDFSPPVPHLEQAGFPLVGGRLDYLAGHPVAALVYARNRHTINLFVWPASAGSSLSPGERASEHNGYHLIRWSDAGMTFIAVSDLNVGELNEFARLIRQAVSPPNEPPTTAR